MPLKLTIEGSASIPKLAERAHLRIAASTSGSNKQDVSNKVLTTAHQIEDFILKIQGSNEQADDSHLPIAHWSKTSLTATSWLENRPVHTIVHQPQQPGGVFGTKPVETEQVRLYKARLEFDVRFRDFAALGEFTSHLSSLDHCEIESTEWMLLPATRESFESQLRLRAAKNAINKVKDYVTALCPGQNVTIVPTSFEGEGGYSSTTNRHGRTMQTARNARSGAMFSLATSESSGGQTLAFTPQEVQMRLSAEFVFEVQTEGFTVDSIVADKVAENSYN